MSDFYSLPPYQYESAADLSSEYYRDVPSPTTNALPDISQEYAPAFKTGPLTSISQRYSGTLSPPTTTAPLVVSDVRTTQSLVAALQSTMNPKTTKSVVIIPGEKKRSKAANEAPSS